MHISRIRNAFVAVCSFYSVNYHRQNSREWPCIFCSTSYKRMPYGTCVLPIPLFSKD